MTKRKKSAPSRGSSKKVSLGDLIVRGFDEGLAHIHGDVQLRTRTVTVPDTIDVRAVREKTGMTQSEFAGRYGFSLRTLQEWEQGRARPDSAVRAYLVVIDRNRAAVEKALAS